MRPAFVAGGLALVAAGAALLVICGKTRPPEVPRSTETDTGPAEAAALCAKLASAPPKRPRGPLPDHPAFAAWIERVEGAADEVLALAAVDAAHGRGTALAPRDAACVEQLWAHVSRKLPERNILRRSAARTVVRLLALDAGEVVELAKGEAWRGAEEEPPPMPLDLMSFVRARTESSRGDGCGSSRDFLAPFPDNARARRALLLHYLPCVEDNFSSIDGPLDRDEPLFRANIEIDPARAGLVFDLLRANDPNARDVEGSTWVWLAAPFGRITLDLGPTGNALRVVRDAARAHPDVVRQLLPVAAERAGSSLPAHRRARWTALLAYLEAGAPEPGDPPEPALARAIAGDARSARWALGYLPNELEEHAPRPYPYVRDAQLVKVLVERAAGAGPDVDEDRVLLLDAISRAPPGTGLAWIVGVAASPNEGVSRAALEAIVRQLAQVDPAGSGAPALLGPHMAGLRKAFAHRVCARDEALRLLAEAEDAELDAEVAACLAGREPPDTSYLQSLFGVCRERRALGWTRTADVLDALAERQGDLADYTRRVARGCRTGKD